MTPPPFRRVLIANRGEIAVRIIRACRELGMEAVAIYSDADEPAMHVRMADAAVRVGPAPAAESYLRIDRVVDAAKEAGCDALHPGYGFLSERAVFARAVVDAGITWVGPRADAIDGLGDKLHARRLARAAGVPIVPGTLEPAPVASRHRAATIEAATGEIGFPLLVKAAAGGGGRGMRRVEDAAGLTTALAEGSREAEAAFGDGSVYLEREITGARHIEVQLLGDDYGGLIAVGERDCSLQRRNQKLVEEAPAPGLTPEQRRELHAMAVRVGSAAGMTNAATAEFLYAADGAFHFLEVNARLQVEHGVTELVGGLDIVREQFHLAAGAPLSAAARAAASRAADPGSHAIEVRIAAEDPGRAFAPTPGRLTQWEMPAGPGVRVDAGVVAGDTVPSEYDNLVAKLMVHAPDRDAAIDRLRRALDETRIAGIQTSLPFHRFVARHAGFRDARVSTSWVADEWDGASAAATHARLAQRAAALVAHLTDGIDAPAVRPADPAERDGRSRSWWRAGQMAAVDRWPR